MPSQTLNLGNFGESGYLPDVAPALLPQTGFSSAVNWRFNEGGQAVVTDGYTNAFDTRGTNGVPYDFGSDTTDLTFLYTWELNQENAVAVYDGTVGRMLFTENDSANGLTEYQLSVENDTVLELGYVTDNPGPGQFTVLGNGNFIMVFADNDDTVAALALMNANREIAIVDNNRTKPVFPDPEVLVATQENNTITVQASVPLDMGRFLVGAYHIRFADVYSHDSLARFKWEGTDALGVPVFNNEVEAPWEFIDGVHPKIAKLTNWPNNATCISFSSFGSVLVATGFVDPDADVGFRGSRRTIAISNPITNAGELPEWDFPILASQSQLFDLSLFTDGLINSGFEANNRFIINSTTDVIALTDNGDGSYSGTKLEIGGGVLTKRTSVAIPNGFFSIGNGQFYTHDTTSYTSIGKGQYSDNWFSRVNEERLDEIQCVYDPRTRSVWIKTPTSDSAQEIWIINLENNNTLSVLNDHQEVRYLEWSAEGTPAESLTWDNIPIDQWDDFPQDSWNEFPVIELGQYRNRILGCGGREVYVHDFGPRFNGRDIDAILEKSYFKLGAQDSYSTFQFDRVFPWVEGPADSTLSVRVGSANTVGSPVVFSPYQTYILDTTQKLDYRLQAKWGAISFRSSTVGTEISGVEIKVNTANRR